MQKLIVEFVLKIVGVKTHQLDTVYWKNKDETSVCTKTTINKSKSFQLHLFITISIWIFKYFQDFLRLYYIRRVKVQ
jgi:hypothetical protein